jgi:hypothetical protein
MRGLVNGMQRGLFSINLWLEFLSVLMYQFLHKKLLDTD